MWEQVWEQKMEFRFLFNKNNYIKDTNGGETGIRTLGTLAGTTDFESVPFDHSGTSPNPAV